MSVYVSLQIDPEHIDPDRWRTVYQQTLQLLKAYKGGLFAAKEEMRGPHTRTVLSRELVRHKQQSGEPYWTVWGDFESKHRGDPFFLSADLNEYRNLKPTLPQKITDDILSRIVQEKTPAWGNVFQQRTQGHPYHMVVNLKGQATWI